MACFKNGLGDLMKFEAEEERERERERERTLFPCRRFLVIKLN